MYDHYGNASGEKQDKNRQPLFDGKRQDRADSMRNEMKKNRGIVYQKALGGEKLFYFSMLLIETAIYTFSFLFSGLVKKDIFNLLEGKEGTLGIRSVLPFSIK